MADEAPVAPAPKPRTQSANSKSYADIEKAAIAKAEAAAKKKNEGKPAASQAAPAPAKRADFFQPGRDILGFTGSTVKGTLNGIARGGKIGFFTGLAAGVVGSIMSGAGISAAMLILTPLGMGIAFCAVGGAIGLFQGARAGLPHHRAARATSNDAVQSQGAARPAGIGRAALAEYHQERKEISDFNYDRMQQQQNENKQDFNQYDTSWQDRVGAGSRGGWAKGL